MNDKYPEYKTPGDKKVKPKSFKEEDIQELLNNAAIAVTLAKHYNDINIKLCSVIIELHQKEECKLFVEELMQKYALSIENDLIQ